MRSTNNDIIKIIFLFSFIILFSCSEDSTTQPEQIPETPVVNIISPTDNSSIGGLVDIIVSATDNKGIVKVEIYIDNETDNLRTFVVKPYEYLWDASNEPNNSKHTIYAKAYDGDDNVSSSKVITVTKITIQTPNNFSAELQGDSGVVCSWNITNPNEYTFVIEEAINSENFQKIFETQSGALTCSIEKPCYKDSLYKYRVSSKKSGVLSYPSNHQTIFVLFPKPTNFMANKINSSNLELSWSDKSDFEKGFIIEKSENGGSFIQIVSLPANSETFVDNSLNENVNNIYKLYAFSDYNNSDFVIVSVLAGAPTISNSVIEPDSLVVNYPRTILTTIEATDPNGQSDIEEVYFIVYRPDGSSNGIKIFLFDDGNVQTNGDLIAGDGVYSRKITVDQTNEKGTYRFEFRAKDLQGGFSNIINHYVKLL